MGKLLICAFLCLLNGCQGLELSLKKKVPQSPYTRATCGVLHCSEVSHNPTNLTTDQDGSDLGVSLSEVASISSLEVFKLEQTSISTNSASERRILLASVTTRRSRLTRVSNGVKVDGLLEAGRATLQLEFTKRGDCRSDFICQVHAVDTEGRELVRTSHIQQQPRESNEQRPDFSWTPGPVMQAMFLMQQLDAKLSVVDSAVARWEDEIGRLKNTLQHDVQSLKSDLNAKADRLEDKILDLGKDSNARTDRLEDKMESLKNNAIQKNHQLEDKAENLCTCLDAKIAQISQDGICDDHKYLASVWSGRFDSLEVLIQDKLQEMSFDMNLTALTTRCMLAAQSVQENTTDSAALKSVLTDLLKPKDCYKGMGSRASFTSSPYTVIEPSQDNSLAAPVLCNTLTDGGGWVVFQRRVTGDVSFYRGWEEYKQGFGSFDGDFWLGLDNIHAITSSGVYELRVDLRYDGNSVFAHYDSFSVGDEESNYVLSVAHYDGNAGDSLIKKHNGRPFSTRDKDNDASSLNCAVEFIGAWWYKSCHDSNLNGQWGASNGRGLMWRPLTGNNAASYTEMKIRRVL